MKFAVILIFVAFTVIFYFAPEAESSPILLVEGEVDNGKKYFNCLALILKMKSFIIN